ncbi:hypothetical protein [Streptomyces sp. NBC_00878]|uniref:hypothetical protein n=1 Tax=Streptomyces sp. NBC_00878 TaxID=2975854 RepID=UPI00225B43AE|nr:hypothetical protein [Streptomyces sp. NBC_00878]MCX4905941.1 hypothetical protein [Streptomyces sp. NBC_00878]
MAPASTVGASSRSPSAQGAKAHCRAYDSVKNRGRVLAPTAWQRLVQAAGGEKNVEAYCAERSAKRGKRQWKR